MAHFAEIGIDNIVLRVIVVANPELLDDDGVEQEQKGIDFCNSLFGGTWLQTSYNGSMRKNFAARNYTYDSGRDAFIPPKPFESWALNEDTCLWEAPVAMPQDDNSYTWDEDSLSWQVRAAE